MFIVDPREHFLKKEGFLVQLSFNAKNDHLSCIQKLKSEVLFEGESLVNSSFINWPITSKY